ncbi:iron-sulfur cluster assembly protein, partial [Rhodococcus sp. EPR-134]
MSVLTESDVRSALARVLDPEIRKPITELGMVKGISLSSDNSVDIGIYLTTAGCPMRTE